MAGGATAPDTADSLPLHAARVTTRRAGAGGDEDAPLAPDEDGPEGPYADGSTAAGPATTPAADPAIAPATTDPPSPPVSTNGAAS
jgi:hypothetical protein